MLFSFFKKNTSLHYLTGLLVVCFFILSVRAASVDAAPNQQINYQGKLTTSAGVAVADGTYNMRFWLLTTPSIATTSAVWTESLTTTNKVQVTNGLFSVMLGSSTPLTSVNFNQTLYLGIEIGGTGSPSWDGEMSPRKVIGTVPVAFEARRLGGFASTSFVRTDAASTIASSTSSSLLSVVQNGAGNILDLFDGITKVFTVLDGGNVGIGTTTPFYKLTVAGDTRITGKLYDSVNSGGSLGQILKSTATGQQWAATSTLGLSSSFTTSAQLAALLSDEIGSGALVFATSPTLVTPNLGTPSTLVGTNITGTASGLTAGNVTTNANLTGMVTSVGNAASLGSFTSANLSTALTDEVGSGATVFATAPTLASTTITGRTKLTNASTTNVTISGKLYDNTGSAGTSGYVLKSTGTGFAWVATSTLGITGGGGLTSADIDTSSELATILTDETGSGALVFGTSPTLSSTTISGILKLSSQTASRGLFTDSQSRATTTALSATLLNSLTDETGTGVAVFATSPTISGPTFTGSITTPLADGCVEVASGVLTSTGVICGTGSGGVTSFNGQTNSSQSFASSTAGIDFKITSSGGVHTFQLPSASATARGLLTSTDWSSFNGRIASTSLDTSAELVALLSDETGTGVAVFATSPTLVTPILGTPTSVTLTNATGLPIATGISGLGANVATFLATPTTANFASAVTDETGSGALVFGTSPTLSSTTISGILKLSSQTASRGLFTDSQSRATTTALSATLLNSLTDETGTGVAVFATSPTFTGTVSADAVTTTGILTVANNINISDTNKGYQIGGNRILYASSTNLSTVVGSGAGTSLNTTGTNNVAIGYQSLYLATSSDNNTANGSNALHFNTNGSSNTASGAFTLYQNTKGVNNTANGYNSLYSNTTGSSNTADGVYSLTSNTTGSGNTASGLSSLRLNTTGTHNTADGIEALYYNTTGRYNTAFGYRAGSYLTDDISTASTTDYSVFLGSNAKALTNNDQNSIVIGYNALGLGSNTVVLGNDSIITTALKGNVGIASSSPSRTLTVSGSAYFGGNITATGTVKLSSQTASRGLFTDSQSRATTTALSATLLNSLTDETGTGVAVFATSPTLVTPNLGTPSTLVGTNITGTAASLTAGNVTTNANLTGMVTSVGNAASLGSFTSANLSTALTDEVGSGATVFATAPTLASTTITGRTKLTNASTTNVTISGKLYDNTGSAGTSGYVLKSTGTGFAWVATSTLGITGGGGLTSADIDTSSELATILTDETGSGALVFGTSPTLSSTTISGILKLSSQTASRGLFTDSQSRATTTALSATLLNSLTDETGSGRSVFSASPAFSGTATFSALTATSALTMSGSAANIALGLNYLSGDGDDEGVYVNTDGDVGIGTTGGSYRLAISSPNSADTLSLTSTAVSGQARLTLTGGSGGVGQIDNSVGHLYITNSATAGDLILRTNSVARMQILANGNIGIGDTNPDNLLDISSSTSQSALAIYSGGTDTDALIKFELTDNSPTFTMGIDDSDSDKFKISGSALGTNDRLVIDSSGNVGIGTSSPEQKLSVADGNIQLDNAYQLLSYNPARSLSYNLIGSDASDRIILGDNTSLIANEIRFHADGSATPNMMVSTAGRVGIGTTTPAKTLSVAGDLRLTGALFDRLNSAGTNGMVLKSTATGQQWVATSTLGLLSPTSIDTSSELAAILTNETGSGALVFGTAPTLSSTTISGILKLSSQTASRGLFTDSQSRATTTALSATLLNSLTDETGTGVAVFGTAPTFTTSITSPSLLATANDSGALGASGTAFSDLFLASGGVINWLAGDVTLTHSADTLTLAGGTFSLATSTQSGRLTLSGSTANIALGSNYLSGDGGDEGVYVSSNGNVGIGIGVSAPNGALQVSQTYEASIPALGSPSTFFNLTNASAWGLIAGTLNTGNVYLQAQRVDTTATAYHMLLQPNGGSVGIGDTNPDNLLDISSSTSQSALAIYSGGTDTDALIKFELTDNSPTFTMGIDDSDSDKFKISGSALGTNDRLVIDSSGNVGIGTSSPAFRLNVEDSQSGFVSKIHNKNTSDGDGLIIRIDDATPATGNLYVSFQRNTGVEIGKILGDAGNIAYATISDVRLKENIASSSYGLHSLLNVQVVDYNFIAYPEFNQNGFLAQQLYEVYPFAVQKPDTDGYWTVDYAKVTPLLVQSIQDQSSILKELLTTGTTSTGALIFPTLHDGNADTVWEKMVALAQRFTNGVLVVTGLKVESLETDQLCIGDTCVNEAQLIQVLDVIQSGNNYTPPTQGVEDPDTGGDGSDAQSNDDDGGTGTTTDDGTGGNTDGGGTGEEVGTTTPSTPPEDPTSL